MRRNNPLVLLFSALMICSTIILQAGIIPAQADSGNLADKAVTYLYSKYQSDGSNLGPYNAYILKSAGVDISGWKDNHDVALTDAVYGSVYQDINTSSTVAKYLAYDLLAAKTLGRDDLVSQLQTILQSKQSSNGFDNNLFSDMIAYDALGRAGMLGDFNANYAKSYILGSQNTVTGATYGSWADFMSTAKAIRALYYLDPGKSDSQIQSAISSGCNWLKNKQQTGGSFQAALDDPLIDTAEAVATQKALGLDPATAWTIGGKSAVDYLNASALNSDGSFGTGKNVMDATWALDSFNLLGILPSGGDGGGDGGGSTTVSVRVRVEGAASNLADATVTTTGTAMDALKAAVGDSNVGTSTSSYGVSIDNIKGESGNPAVATGIGDGWCYYVIRSGAMTVPSAGADTYAVSDGDQIIFYIGAYQTVSPWANKTYLPVVSVSPQSPTAGQPITLTISAKNNDWMSGLVDLTPNETAAIGNYTVTVGTNTYTSQSGVATIPGSAVTAGTLTYAVTNQNSAGYPNVVRYAGSISVSNGGSSSTGCSVGVAVVGMNGEKLFGSATVSVSSGNQWGLTALGALDAAIGSSSYVVSSGSYGYWVTSIKGQANGTPSSTAGWMFTVNDTAPMVGADKCTVSDGDHVIWYYSKTMDQDPPTWAQLISGSYTPSSASVVSTTGSASVDPAAGGTISLGSDATVNIPASALIGSTSTTVAIQKVSSPPAAPTGFQVLGSVFEFTVGSSTGYKFAKPVTLTFSFNPAALSTGETPAVYYYDTASAQWVNLGGTVSGSTITVSVDHFTKFAVLAGKAAAPVVPTTASTTPASFSDVPASYWAHDAISSLSGLGYVAGYPDGAFKPANQITRAEFVSILNKVLKLAAAPAGAGTRPAVPDFSDVAPGDWYYGSVENVVYAGIVKGYGRTFDPNRQITREEMAAILVNALDKQGEAKESMSARTDFTDDTGISGWARGFVAVAVRDGLIRGYAEDNSSRPKNGATRAEACAMIMNFLNIHKQDG